MRDRVPKRYIVKEFKHNLKKIEHSIIFGDYEAIFILSDKSDIQKIKYSFTQNRDDWSVHTGSEKIRVVLKNNGKIIKQGNLLYSEDYKEENNETSLCFTVESGFENEYRLFIYPEYGETMLDVYKKLFKI